MRSHSPHNLFKWSVNMLSICAITRREKFDRPRRTVQIEHSLTAAPDHLLMGWPMIVRVDNHPHSSEPEDRRQHSIVLDSQALGFFGRPAEFVEFFPKISENGRQRRPPKFSAYFCCVSEGSSCEEPRNSFLPSLKVIELPLAL